MKSKLIALAVIIFVLAGFSTSAQIDDNIAPVQISTSDVVCAARGGCQPAMAVDDNLIFVVWPEKDGDNQNTLYFATSTDEGQTFASPTAIPITTSPNTRHPAVTIAEDGTVLLTWTDDRTGNDEVLITASNDDGSTWKWDDNGDFFNLSNNEGESFEPSVSASQFGTVMIAWSDNTIDEDINPDGGRNIFIRVTFNPGQAGQNVLDLFSRADTLNVSKRFIASLGSPATAPQVEFSPTSTLDNPGLFLVWQQAVTSDEEIFFHQLQAFTPVIVSDPDVSFESRNPTFAVTTLDQMSSVLELTQAVIAWEEPAGSRSRIMSSGSTEVSLPFTQPTFSDRILELSDTDEFATNPDITANSEGEFFIVWQSDDLDSSDPTAIRMRFLSNAFSPVINISERDGEITGDAMNPVVGTDLNKVYVAWVEESNVDGFSDIYFAGRSRLDPF